MSSSPIPPPPDARVEPASLAESDVLNSGAARYFLEVARSVSIRQAADRIGVAPSAISRQIARLEHDLRAELIERRSDGIALTEAGKILLGHLEAIRDRLDRIGGDIADLKALRRGRVQIATVEGITRPFLSTQIARFRAAHPGVELHLRSCGRRRVLEALEERRSQIGFIYDHFSHPALIEAGRWRQPLLALVPAGHALVARRGLTLGDLAQTPCALPDESFGIHHLVMRAFSRQGLVPYAPVQSDSLGFLRDYVMQEGCVTFMPLQAALSEIRAGDLVPLDLDCPEFQHRHIYAVLRREHVLPPAASAFLADVVAAFAEGEQHDAALLASIRLAQA